MHKTTTSNAVGDATINAATAGLPGRHMLVISVNDLISGKTVSFGNNFKSTGPLLGSPGKSATLQIHFRRRGVVRGRQNHQSVNRDREEAVTETCSFGAGRRVFQTGALTFGIAISHEGWRYPETVRWAARHGAHMVSTIRAGIFKPGRIIVTPPQSAANFRLCPDSGPIRSLIE